MNLQNLRDKLQSAKGQKKLLESQLKENESDRNSLKQLHKNYVKSKWVLSEVQRITQQTFQSRVESLVTMAVRSVFDRDFRFELEFKRERNALAVTPKVFEGENEYIPKQDMGGSILDIIGTAFRVVLWSLEKPKSRNLFILDEPGKWLGKLVVKYGSMLKEISEGLNFQVLMSTHDEELLMISDRTWEIENKGNGSTMRVMGEEKTKVRKLKLG